MSKLDVIQSTPSKEPMNIEESDIFNPFSAQVAPGLRNESDILDFPEPAKRKRGGSKPGRPMPWNDGNQFARKHGVYCAAFTPEEKAERKEYERQLEADLGIISTAQRSIIHRASWLEIRLRRNERASAEGQGEIASEHVLSWINSQRLLLCALGLERRQKPEQSFEEHLKSMTQEKGNNEQP